MIVYKEKSNWKRQSEDDYEELKQFKAIYKKRITLYEIYIYSVGLFGEENVYEQQSKISNFKDKVSFFQNQIDKIDCLMNEIKEFDIKKGVVIEKEVINEYNEKYQEIKNTFNSNSLIEEEITSNYINGLLNDFTATLQKIQNEYDSKIEYFTKENIKSDLITSITKYNDKKEIMNNDTLFISEPLNKVFLPYTAQEVMDIFNNYSYKYKTIEDVIEDKFTRPFSDFKIQFISRYKETIKLAKERENYGLTDAIALATEMMGKRFLHPAIIAACRSLNELDVYLDCLDKNELDDFKIFKIEYQLYPTVVKKQRNEYYQNDNNDYKYMTNY